MQWMLKVRVNVGHRCGRPSVRMVRASRLFYVCSSQHDFCLQENFFFHGPYMQELRYPFNLCKEMSIHAMAPALIKGKQPSYKLHTPRRLTWPISHPPSRFRCIHFMPFTDILCKLKWVKITSDLVIDVAMDLEDNSFIISNLIDLQSSFDSFSRHGVFCAQKVLVKFTSHHLFAVVNSFSSIPTPIKIHKCRDGFFDTNI